jgi:hypothetical protein
MNRRAFIAALSSAAAWPVEARAQGQANVQRIGYLGSGSPASSGHYATSFRDALGKLGYVEGRNVSDHLSLGGGKVRPTFCAHQ